MPQVLGFSGVTELGAFALEAAGIEQELAQRQ
jgi:hypothetical protein